MTAAGQQCAARAKEVATPSCLSFEVSHGARVPGGPSVPQQSFRSSPAQKPRVSESDFEDLLPTQGFSSKADRRGPRTIAEMRRRDQARDVDPLKLKVRSGRWGGRGYPGHLCTPRLSERTAHLCGLRRVLGFAKGLQGASRDPGCVRPAP